MLLAVTPLTFVDTTILPSERTLSFTFVILEFARIPLSVFPSQIADSVHFIFQPFSIVSLAIRPHILSLPRDLILEEQTSVDASVSKFKRAFSIFLSVFVTTFVAGRVRPSFDACAVLFVLEPVTNVGRSIRVLVSTLSVCFIVQPATFIHVTIGVDQSPLTVGLIIFPHTVVLGAIWPNLHTMSVFFAIYALSCVNRSIRECNGSAPTLLA
jgi:hypothetical protein